MRALTGPADKVTPLRIWQRALHRNWWQSRVPAKDTLAGSARKALGGHWVEKDSCPQHWPSALVHTESQHFIVSVCFFFFLSEIRSHSGAQTFVKLPQIRLSQPSKCWDYATVAALRLSVRPSRALLSQVTVTFGLSISSFRKNKTTTLRRALRQNLKLSVLDTTVTAAMRVVTCPVGRRCEVWACC